MRRAEKLRVHTVGLGATEAFEGGTHPGEAKVTRSLGSGRCRGDLKRKLRNFKLMDWLLRHVSVNNTHDLLPNALHNRPSTREICLMFLCFQIPMLMPLTAYVSDFTKKWYESEAVSYLPKRRSR